MHHLRISLPVKKPHLIVSYDSLFNTNRKCSLDIKDRNNYREKELEKIQASDKGRVCNCETRTRYSLTPAHPLPHQKKRRVNKIKMQ